MTIKEAFQLFSELQTEKIADIKSTKLAYCLNKNLEEMNKALNPFRIQMPERIKDYRADVELARKNFKDEELKAKLEKLEEEYKVDKAAWEVEINAQEEKLSAELMFKFYTIKMNDLPEDLTPLQFAVLRHLIKE
jgi:hypothetical protein